MLSRLQAISQLSRVINGGLKSQNGFQSLQNVMGKRWSGHNAMEIKPSSTDLIFLRNWFHFYALLGLIPVTVLGTILGIRDNPELSEIPDGYEPRYYEYFKHPVTRWTAKYLFNPPEWDHETKMSMEEVRSEHMILRNIVKKVEKIMAFYNDHRTIYFQPKYAEEFRIGREEGLYLIPHSRTEESNKLVDAYDPDINVAPTEGYPDGPMN